MLIPRHSVIQRAGLVLAGAAIIAIAIGLPAAAPEPTDFVRPTGNPQPTLQQSFNASQQCDSQFKKQKHHASGGIFGFDQERARELFIEACMQGKFAPQSELFKPSVIVYLVRYLENVTTVIALGQQPREWLQRSLYWGARALIVGLFLIYVFEITLGKVLRYIWRGSQSA